MRIENFFTLSHALHVRSLEGCENEICIRTAINRLHYGIFHWLIAYFHIIIPEKEIPCCHKYVQEKIEEYVDDNVLIDSYHNLEDKRNIADYDLSRPLTKQVFQKEQDLKNLILARLAENPQYIPSEPFE